MEMEAEMLRLIEHIKELDPTEMDRLLEIISIQYDVVAKEIKTTLKQISNVEEEMIPAKRERQRREAEFSSVQKLVKEQKAELQQRTRGRRSLHRRMNKLDLCMVDLQKDYGEVVVMHKYTAAASGFKITIGLATAAVGVACVLRVYGLRS